MSSYNANAVQRFWPTCVMCKPRSTYRCKYTGPCSCCCF